MTAHVSRRTALALLASAASATPARADGHVDLQLVLAVDTSGSVNRQRFELQRDGYADAFRSPDVQRVVLGGRAGAIAVCMTHWTGPGMQDVSQPWIRLGDVAACNAFADAIAASPRRLFAGGTSISGAIDHARAMLGRCPFTAPNGRLRRVIDVSGDGENNRGRPPSAARDEAVAHDVTINGLPITAIEPRLDDYYRDHVIGGQAAFLIAVDTFEAFGPAVRRKLLQEIA
jgi:Protein of unknown function (DUF1194)